MAIPAAKPSRTVARRNAAVLPGMIPRILLWLDASVVISLLETFPGGGSTKSLRTRAAPLAWLVLPVQPVDATPSNALIREWFPDRTHLSGRTRSKPGQGSVLLT